MASYAVAHLDEIEEFADVGCHYRPIRHHLGITAFGVTAWTARAAGDLVINEHDEDDPTADQERLASRTFPSTLPVVGVTGTADQYVVGHSLIRNQRQKRRVRIRRGQ
jgi:hypothetical protein